MKDSPKVLLVSDDKNFLNSEGFILGSLGVEVDKAELEYKSDSITALVLQKEYDFAVVYFPRYDSLTDYLILRLFHTYKSRIRIIISTDCCYVDGLSRFAKRNAFICPISEIVKEIFRIFSVKNGKWRKVCVEEWISSEQQ